MDAQNRMLIEHACTALSHAFAHHLDQRDYAGVAAQFADNGVWIRHGKRLEGPGQILEAMNQRPANQFTRHLTTNVHFIAVGPERARASVYNISYFSFDVTELPGTFEPAQQMLIEFEDSYVNTADGWKILERDTRPLLIPDSMRAAMRGH